MTIKESLKKSVDLLRDANIDNPVSKSKTLLAHTLQKSKEYLLINENEILQDKLYNEFFFKIDKLIRSIPIQYITKAQEFMGIKFYVDENVLIPRPDTETLVEECLNIIRERKYKTVIDMCTGSGAIAVSIAKHSDVRQVYAVDISNKALYVANKNALNNDVIKKIQFINSNMFENINKKVDIIISNPPYIETEVINTLATEVQAEPKIALDGGIDGLDFYRNLLINSKKYLNKDGTICMEIGYNQREAVINLFKTQYKNIYCKKDLAGNDRVIVCNNE